MSKGKARLRPRTQGVHLAAVLACGLTLPRLVRAAEPPVAIGEVATRVSRSGIDLPTVVRRALERELEIVVLKTHGKRYVISASLVRLEENPSPSGARIEGTVSVVLREAKGGAIRAIVEGRGRTEVEAASAALELGVVEAAARAAVAALPDAVR
jgi:hypothetical protein